MELIPYTSREGREIVLRHRNALVVRDPTSQRLEIRGLSLTECPTCHQPFRARASSPERHFDAPPTDDDSFVNPGYFRMLRAPHGPEQRPPSSPIRRLTQPALPIPESRIQEVDDADSLPSASVAADTPASVPASTPGPRIRKEAFSPNYFTTFFVEEKELGRGGKGVVLLVRHEIDGCHLGHFACKRVPVGNDHVWLEKVLVEVELLAKLSHPNLVSYRHVWLEDVKLHRFGAVVPCAFILQQYCNGGDLLQYIVGEQPKETTKEQLKAQMRRRSRGHIERRESDHLLRQLSLEEIYSLFRDIVSGLAYLHNANYIHRDLKPSNCLLHRENGKLTCLISDFGEVQPESAVRKSTGTTGTISYCAPEVLLRDDSGSFGNFTTKSDVFSLGMILYFLCFRRLPYRNANSIQEELEDIDLLRAEITGWKGFQQESNERSGFPPQLYHLLKRMLSLSPSERPTAADVLEAMNQESTNMGGPRRDSKGTGPALAIHEHRIQNLDSPMAPGTPIPDPTKPSFRDIPAENPATHEHGAGRVYTQAREAAPQADLQKSLEHDGSPHAAMTLSRSRDAVSRHQAWPEDEDAHEPAPSPPLLMAPPSTFWGDMAHKGALFWHVTCRSCRGNSESLVFLVRLGVFLLKMASLARMCWPMTARLEIGTPLIGLAAMDLGMPHQGASVVARREEQPRIPRRSASSRWQWSWTIGGVLFILHFAILWSASCWSRPCNSPWNFPDHSSPGDLDVLSGQG